MANVQHKLSVAVLAETAVIKVKGRANAALSVQFKSLAAELRDTGRKNLVVDLGECEMMDSTFLGVLAGLVANVAPGSPQAQEYETDTRVSTSGSCVRFVLRLLGSTRSSTLLIL